MFNYKDCLEIGMGLGFVICCVFSNVKKKNENC